MAHETEAWRGNIEENIKSSPHHDKRGVRVGLSYNDENIVVLGSVFPKVEKITVNAQACKTLATHLKAEIDSSLARSRMHLSGYELSRYREIAGSLFSHRGLRLGKIEKIECLGSGTDTKAAANVPNVCPDCVRRQNEEFSDLICS